MTLFMLALLLIFYSIFITNPWNCCANTIITEKFTFGYERVFT